MNILGLGTAVPDRAIPQAAAADVSEQIVCSDRRQRRLLRALFQRAGVQSRYSVLLEPSGNGSRQSFYRPRAGISDRGPGTAQRMAEYEGHGLRLSVRAAARAMSAAGLHGPEVTHLITVSCTGFFAPGIDIGLIDELGLAPGVSRTHVGFMGCHGTFNALAVARAIVSADPDARVLVCALELCSLHFHYAWDAEKLVANALFGDGAAALVCAGSEVGEPVLRVRGTGSVLLPDSRDAMSWRVGDHGVGMTLSPGVPKLIERHLPGWLMDWLALHGLELGQIRTWAVHPGGPRILGAMERAAALGNGALKDSRAVLERYGNMSSVTIVFILERLLAGAASTPGVALGFGPGLVAEAMLLEFPDHRGQETAT